MIIRFCRFSIAITVAISSVALAFGASLHLGKVSFDRQSQKLTVVYGNPGYNETTLTDSGPVLICVLNRLLTEKYGFYQVLPEGKTISKADLALLTQSARLLPQDEGQKIIDSVRSYMQNPSKETGTTVVRTLHSSIGSGLKNHETDFSMTSQQEGAVTGELKGKLSRVETKIKAILDGTTEAALDEDEKVVVRKLKRERLVLEEQIADAKPVAKKEEGRESPAKYSLCVKDESSKSRTGIDNENVDDLLKDVKVALDALVPAGSTGFSTRSGTHN